MLAGSPTRAPLGSVGFQPTKNLLFIVRICPRFWFLTNTPRPLVSFPSPLQEVGILCVCLCLLVFLSNLVLYYRTDVLVHSFCMTPKDALLFVPCRTYIYRFLSGSSVLALLRMIHVPLGSEPFQALDRGSPLFCYEGLDIFRVSIGLSLFQAIEPSKASFRFSSGNLSVRHSFTFNTSHVIARK